MVELKHKEGVFTRRGTGKQTTFLGLLKCHKKRKKIFKGGFQGPRDLETKQTPSVK
jgi:hypothetical protein